MYLDERDQLLALFSNPDHWCQHAEARTTSGAAVRYNDPEAAAWDLTGALYRLFGWQRACILFVQIDKHLLHHRSLKWRVQDVHIESMLALQELNDHSTTDYQWLMHRLGNMPAIERPLFRKKNVAAPPREAGHAVH
jgi:hypothetical protein